MALDHLFDKAVVRDPLYLFLPLFLSGAFTALVLAVHSLVGLGSDGHQSFQHRQSISKGAPR